MQTFICDRCQHEFKSGLARPPCPQGCRYPIEMSSVSADLITTRPVDPVESQPASHAPSPPRKKRKTRNDKGKRKPAKKQEQPAPNTAMGTYQPYPAAEIQDSTKVFRELARVEAELPENKAPGTLTPPEVPKN